MKILQGAIQTHWSDRDYRLTAVCGLALLSALLLALTGDSDHYLLLAIALISGVLLVLMAIAAPRALNSMRGWPVRSLSVTTVLIVAVVLISVRLFGYMGTWVAFALLSAFCGQALIGDQLRARTRSAGRRAQRSPWQQLTAIERIRILPWRIAIGALLVFWSAFLGVVIVGPPIFPDGGFGVILIVASFLGGALLVIGLPLLISAAANSDRVHLAQTREEERQRLAAHLHDSVLQTLSLVQRQAENPATVRRLARHQERELRAWLAGQSQAKAETLAGSLQIVTEQVEEEEDVQVEFTVIGDRPLDNAGEALIAAAREALRNASRYARNSNIVLFTEINGNGTAVYVRDNGPGFDLSKVRKERRGIRDSIIGRMALAGGQAVINSKLGEGTEVELRLPSDAGAGEK